MNHSVINYNDWTNNIDEWNQLVTNATAECKFHNIETGSTNIAETENSYPTTTQILFELSIAHHMFSALRMDDLVWNHISIRKTKTTKDFYVTPFPIIFEDITPKELLNSSISENDNDNTTGTIIHSAIYNARPDVYAIVHLHSPAIMAISCLKNGLDFLIQDSGAFYNQVAYHKWQGMSDDFAEQEILEEDFKNIKHHTLIMENHGACTVGKTIGEAWTRMYNLEKICKLQLEVMKATGGNRDLMIIPSNDILIHTAKQYDQFPNNCGVSEWPALVKWWSKRQLRHAPAPWNVSKL